MEHLRFARRTGLALLAALGLTASVERPVSFSDAVESVARHGGSVALHGTDCSFDQLESEGVKVQRVLADEADFTGAIIAGADGQVTDYGNVQCIVRGPYDIELRGADGW